MKPWLALSLLMATSLFAAAQDAPPATQPSGPPPAPLPAALSTAHKLFLGNAGDQDNADCLRAYNDLYAALGGIGRYQMVSDPSASDLVLELHYEFSLGAGVNGGSNTPRQFRLILIDPKTHVILWTLVERTNYAALERNRNKNLDEVIGVLATDLDQLLSAKPPANKSSIHHGLFQPHP
jgi:hypothetical protein